MHLSRRAFVGLSTGLLASGLLPRHLVARRAVRVLVVGGGPAGLTAAYELQLAGHDVRVFEARDRPGGRMYTMREPFSGGLHAEVGAMYLGGATVEVARELGMDLVPPAFDPSLGSLAHVRGRRVVIRDGEPVDWPVELAPDEEGLSLFALESKYFRAPLEAMPVVDRLRTGATPDAEALALDDRSIESLLDEGGASAGARELIGLGYYGSYGGEAGSASLLQLALERGSFRDADGFLRVSSGNDGICAELARRLGNAVTYRSPVRAVRQDDAGVAITLEGPSGTATVEGDFAILTPPPPVLRDIHFEPALSAPVMRSFAELPAVPATRVFAETRSRFWESEGLSGSAVTDGPLASLQHMTAGQEGEGGILESYGYGARARAMAALSEGERLATLRSGLEELYPETADLSDRGASHAWGEDPWARCNFVTFLPGQVREFLGAMREPQGRVHLAGDTVGGVPGYSHAAFHSGREAAARIIAEA